MPESPRCGRCGNQDPTVRKHLVDQHRELRQDGMTVVGVRYAVVDRCDACMDRLRRREEARS
jgi:hypothetical protein